MSEKRWIDWNAQPLGQEPDTHIARRLGVMHSGVRNQRLKRGIAAFPKGKVDWSTVVWGEMCDVDMARLLGVRPQSVSKMRRKLGVGRFHIETSCPCGVSIVRPASARRLNSVRFCSWPCTNAWHRAGRMGYGPEAQRLFVAMFAIKREIQNVENNR